MVNPFIVNQPQQFDSGISSMIGGIQQQNKLDANAQKQQQQQVQMESDFSAAIESNDPNEVARFSVRYPQAAKTAQDAFGFSNERSEGLSTEAYSKVLGAKDNEEAAKILESYVSKVAASGGKPNNMLSDIEGLRSGESDLNNIRMSVALTKPDLWANYSSYKESIGDKKAKPMTEYQSAMIKGGDADREIRKIEAENKQSEVAIKKETNQVKLDELKNKVEANKTKAVKIEKARNDAAISIVDSGKSTLDLINKIKNHEGFESAIGAKGASSLFGIYDDPIAGTEASGVRAIIDTLEAQNFLTAIGEFKSAGGAGALSDNEGKKLSAALSSLNVDQNEKSFKESLNVIERLVKKQITKATPQIKKINAVGAEAVDHPLTNPAGWALMTDANGNQAYVGPNNEVEEL